jgi:hypothetical protein
MVVRDFINRLYNLENIKVTGSFFIEKVDTLYEINDLIEKIKSSALSNNPSDVVKYKLDLSFLISNSKNSDVIQKNYTLVPELTSECFLKIYVVPDGWEGETIFFENLTADYADKVTFRNFIKRNT